MPRTARFRNRDGGAAGGIALSSCGLPTGALPTHGDDPIRAQAVRGPAPAGPRRRRHARVHGGRARRGPDLRGRRARGDPVVVARRRRASRVANARFGVYGERHVRLGGRRRRRRPAGARHGRARGRDRRAGLRPRSGSRSSPASVPLLYREGGFDHLPLEGEPPGRGPGRDLARHGGHARSDDRRHPRRSSARPTRHSTCAISATYDTPNPNDPFWFGSRFPFPLGESTDPFPLLVDRQTMQRAITDLALAPRVHMGRLPGPHGPPVRGGDSGPGAARGDGRRPPGNRRDADGPAGDRPRHLAAARGPAGREPPDPDPARGLPDRGRHARRARRRGRAHAHAADVRASRAPQPRVLEADPARSRSPCRPRSAQRSRSRSASGSASCSPGSPDGRTDRRSPACSSPCGLPGRRSSWAWAPPRWAR